MGEDLREYIDRKMKIGKMDSFLLYLTSLFGFLYSLSQFFFGTKEDIIWFIPLLIPGMVLPIYFGYCCGALRDSAEDRIRGWIYFITGIPFYGLQLLNLFVQKQIEQYISIDVAKVVPFLLMLLTGFLVGMLAGRCERKLEGLIFYLCRRESSLATSKMTSATGESAVFLSMALFMAPLLKVSSSTEFPSRFLFMIIFLVASCILWRSSNKWSVLSKYSEYIMIRESEPLPKYRLFRAIEITSLGLLVGYSIIISSLIKTPLTGLALTIGISLLLGISSVCLFSTIMCGRYSSRIILEIKDGVKVPSEIKKVLEKLVKELS
jgi:hypothetical protein